jgi:hypothetical protein
MSANLRTSRSIVSRSIRRRTINPSPSWCIWTRNVLRLLLDRVPDDTLVALDLSELTDCCVEMYPRQPIAGPTRQEQLQRVAVDSPLIVLTEGSTDSRLLSDGMKITHPHLSGFINFIDFDSFKAEGGVAMLPKIVYAFIASGVANRIAAPDRTRFSEIGPDSMRRDITHRSPPAPHSNST